MTVGVKLHQCLAACEGVTADLKTFALDTQNKQAKALYSQLATQMESITSQLRSRVNQVEAEEPQYKVFQQAMQQGTAPQQAQMQQQQMQQPQMQQRQQPPQMQ